MKKIIIFVIIFVVVAGGAFYGGMKYGQTKALSSLSRNSQNASPGQRQFSGRNGTNGANRGGFLSGQVLSKDNQSLTLKMSDGSSKIIFFSDSTQISKMADATTTDIEIGKQIMVIGQQNSDGSYTANTIQLSPIRPQSQANNQ